MSRCPIALAAVARPRRPLALLTPGAERIGRGGAAAWHPRIHPGRSPPGAPLALSLCPAHAPPVQEAAETPREHPELAPASPSEEWTAGATGRGRGPSTRP